MDIEWKTYVEPVLHRDMAEVTEANVLEFCRQFGWALSFEEVKCAPYPDGRVTVMQVSGLPATHGSTIRVPFWVQLRGEKAYSMGRGPGSDWTVA